MSADAVGDVAERLAEQPGIADKGTITPSLILPFTTEQAPTTSTITICTMSDAIVSGICSSVWKIGLGADVEDVAGQRLHCCRARPVPAAVGDDDLVAGDASLPGSR